MAKVDAFLPRNRAVFRNLGAGLTAEGNPCLARVLMLSAEGLFAMNQQLCLEIKELMVSELNLSDVRPCDIADDAPLFGDGSGLSLDSLDALQLAVAIEEQFQTKIPEGDKAREIFANVASIAAYVEQHRCGS